MQPTQGQRGPQAGHPPRAPSLPCLAPSDPWASLLLPARLSSGPSAGPRHWTQFWPSGPVCAAHGPPELATCPRPGPPRAAPAVPPLGDRPLTPGPVVTWLHAALSQSPRVTVARIAARLGPVPRGHRAPCRENFTSSRGEPAARAAEAGTAGQLVRPASVPDPALPVGASWERAGAAGGSLEPARGCAQAGGVSAACVGPSEDAGSAAPPGRWVPGPAALPSGERRALPPGGRQEAAARAHPARRRGPGGGGTACPCPRPRAEQWAGRV